MPICSLPWLKKIKMRACRNADGNDSTWLSGRLAKTFADEIANNEEYAFLREGSELEELLAQLEAL